MKLHEIAIYMFLGALTALIAAGITHDRNTSTVSTDEAQQAGTPTYTIVIDTVQHAYKGKAEIGVIDLQILIDVKPDGIVGPVTCKRVMDLNRLDEIK